MESGDISHQIVEAVTGHLSRTIQVNAIKLLHDFSMIGDLKIRNDRLTISLHLNIFSVILTDRYTGIYDIRDGHHNLFNLFFQLSLTGLQLRKPLRFLSHLLLQGFSFFPFPLCH